MKKHITNSLFFCVLSLSFSNTANAATCVKATSKIKNGKVTTTLSSVEREACKKGEVLAQAGATGAKGDTGATGDTGPAGPTLVRQTQNPSGTGFSTTYTTVAVIGENASYSGSYSTGLTHPSSGGSSYLAVNVQVHLSSLTGTGVTCIVEANGNGGTYGQIASISVDESEEFLNAAFPSFTAGTVLGFRVRCKTSSGNGSAKAEMAVIAGFIS